MSFKEFLKEKNNIDDLINRIKQYMIDENGEDSWEDVVNHQSLSECQYIADSLDMKFHNEGVRKVFGEIETDEPYTDAEGEEQNKMTHHWIMINNIPYDFSKGTLRDYINMDKEELYDPEIYDYSIYTEISGG